METLSQFTFRNCSWLFENENCLGAVRKDLKLHCFSLDWKMVFAFFLS